MEFCTVFFLVLYFATKKYKSQLLSIVILFYVAASLCGVYCHYFIDKEGSYTILSVLFQLSIIFLFLCPVIVYGKREKQIRMRGLNYTSFKCLSIFFMSIQLFSVLYFIPYDVQLFLGGSLGEVRNALSYGESSTLAGSGLFRTIAGVASFYYCITILLYFYSICFCKESNTFNNLLLIASTSRIFQAFSYVGRDGILFWIFSFIFSYFLFKPYMPESKKVDIRKKFLVFGGFAFALLAAISISRFGAGGSSDRGTGTLSALMDYFGQGFNNFGRLFERFHDYYGSSSIFPWFYGKTGVTGVEAVQNTVDFYNRYGIHSNVFYTFVGNLYKAYGPILTLVISVCWNFVCSNILKKSVYAFSELLLLMFVVQIVWHNYFYIVYANRVGNLFMVTLPMIMLYCKMNTGGFLKKQQS